MDYEEIACEKCRIHIENTKIKAERFNRFVISYKRFVFHLIYIFFNFYQNQITRESINSRLSIERQENKNFIFKLLDISDIIKK